MKPILIGAPVGVADVEPDEADDPAGAVVAEEEVCEELLHAVTTVAKTAPTANVKNSFRFNLIPSKHVIHH